MFSFPVQISVNGTSSGPPPSLVSESVVRLPVKFRCEYNIATLGYRRSDGILPSYLSASLCTHPPIIERKSLETQSQICWRPFFQFHCPNCLEFVACQLAESPHPLFDFKAQLKIFLFNRHFLKSRRTMMCVSVWGEVNYVYVCVYGER